MKSKKLLSLLLTLTMIMSYFVAITPVHAAVDFNGTGGGSYATPGSGGLDMNWAMPNLTERFGYRVSMYFAPQLKDENDQYVYDSDGNPEWNWPEAIQVGRTIDIKDSPMLYENKQPRKPYRWGKWSAKDYASDGGAYEHEYEYDSADYGGTYYYYAFTNDDVWEKNNKDTSYICAILNKDVLTDENCTQRITQEVLDVKYRTVRDEILNLKDSTSEQSVKDICDEQIQHLNKAYFKVDTVDKLDLPIVNNKPELGTKEQPKYTYDADLQYYLINPAILEVIIDAMGANMNAVDFYLGCWDGPTGDPDKQTMQKKYTHGIFKLVVENMIIHNYKGAVSAMTARDLIALQNVLGKNNNFVNNLVSAYASVFNTIKLTKPEKGFLQVNDEWYMGKLLENGGVPVDYPESEIPTMHHYYDIDKSVGNYMGLGVITSNSILARADKYTDSKFMSYMGLYHIGHPEQSSGIETIAKNMFISGAILAGNGEELANKLTSAVEELSKQPGETRKALKYKLDNSDLLDAIRNNVIEISNCYKYYNT